METLQFALNMELDGEQYYESQAAKYAATPLKPVFALLAKDEAKHAGIIRAKMQAAPYELKANGELANQTNLFSGLGDYQTPVEELPNQASLYHAALEIEKKSIDLYTDLRTKATDAQTQELFDFLVQEETKHHQLLEDMFRLVNRPNEWVEAAEFGVREEY